MTNEKLLRKGRALKVDEKAVWLVEGRIVLVCRPWSADKKVPDKFALLFHDNVRVGIVYFMGSSDIHVLTFPEHRGKGYMSHFMRSGVIGLVEPELRMTTVEQYYSENFEASKHLAELAGLHCCETEEERQKFMRRQYAEQSARLSDIDEEPQTCGKCGAHKSYKTVARCWKCGAEYEGH